MPLAVERGVEPLAGRVGVAAALLEIEDGDVERRDGFRPSDAGFVVKGLDHGGDQPARPDAVGAHMHRRAPHRPDRRPRAFIGSEYLVPK